MMVSVSILNVNSAPLLMSEWYWAIFDIYSYFLIYFLWIIIFMKYMRLAFRTHDMV
jgi:hypothetical protein